MSGTVSWSEALRSRTAPAASALVESLPNAWVRCWACGHACKIPPGRPGICQVRFNDAGTLRVPHGYVGALACDPIEKKPFFHVLPGTEALSFGMLGCDLHCAYCFPGDTSVATDRGPMPIEEVFRTCKSVRKGRGARVATDCDLRAVTGSGRLRAIQAVFEHEYQGDLLTIHPMYLPPLRLTPDHRVYATTDPSLPPRPVHARDLTSNHWLAVPRQHVFGERTAIDAAASLAGIQVTYRGHSRFSADDRVMILTSTERGGTSREIGAALGTSGSSVRHMRRRLRAGMYESAQVSRQNRVTGDFHLVPIRDISRTEFVGLVYNMQVEEEHNYLAEFFLVSNCQNWETSQAIRDPAAQSPPRPVSAAGIIELARRYGAPVVASTYNEPLITSEWAVEVFRAAKTAGLRTAFISNGNGTDRVLDYLQPWVDFYKVDLKSFQDRNYRQLGGRLDRILDTIPKLVERGFWVEIVTLVIPGFNDSDAELRDIAAFLAGVSPDIPWHVTAFHKDYRMMDPDDTPVATLRRGWEIGRTAGLRYVYAGNRPGRVGDRECTRCPSCNALLVARKGFTVLENRLEGNRCPDCRTVIAGPWDGHERAPLAAGIKP